MKNFKLISVLLCLISFASTSPAFENEDLDETAFELETGVETQELNQNQQALAAECGTLKPVACQAFRGVNAYRVQKGLQPLKILGSCVRAAEYHAKNMAVHKFFSHDAPNETWRQRMIRYNLLKSVVAENIALTSQGPNHAVQLWIQSAPHRKNLLNPRLRSAGIGHYQGYYVQCLSGQPGQP